jgi:hypothetical protein
MSDQPVRSKPRRRAIPSLSITWLLLYFAARGLLEWTHFGTGVRVAIALAPIPVFAAFLWQVIQGVRSADEFERRVHLEALAVAYPLVMLLFMTLALMQRAVNLSFQDWSYAHTWIYLPLFYFAGLALARKRYA